jgi:hypothetical protein
VRRAIEGVARASIAADRRWWARPAVQGTILAAVIVGGMAGNTRLDAPPRFDGAGYGVLARSLLEGQGYREIDHPDRPRHAHFPPGYPLALALLWSITGVSARAAHLFSMACTTAAVLLYWRWLRRLYRPSAAGLLGLALACNWRWQRDGGAIQSEPLYLLLTALALLLTSRTSKPGSLGRGAGLGAMLGLAALTRHVGVGMIVACPLELGLRGRRKVALTAVSIAVLIVLPWLVWLRAAGRATQAALLPSGGFGRLIGEQALFYARRLPDQLAGPVVEIATVFRPGLALPATLGALGCSALIVWGWIRCLRVERRRLAGLVPLTTLPILLVWPFTEAGRFLVPLVPFILVGAVEGLGVLLARTGQRQARQAAAVAVLLATLPYSAYVLITNRAEAQRHLHDDFDAACAWIAQHGQRPGPILTRHPGEVHWQTGRSALAPSSDDPAEIDRLIDRYGVAYLLIDEDRYANAPVHPLARYAEEHAGTTKPRFVRGTVVVREAGPTR